MSTSFDAFVLAVTGPTSLQPVGMSKLAGVDLQSLPKSEFALVVHGTRTLKLLPTIDPPSIKTSSQELVRLNTSGHITADLYRKVADVLLRRAKDEPSVPTVEVHFDDLVDRLSTEVAVTKTSSATPIPPDAVGAIKLAGAPSHPLVYRDVHDLAAISQWANAQREKLSGADLRNVARSIVEQLGEWGNLDGPQVRNGFPDWVFTLGGNKVSSNVTANLLDRWDDRRSEIRDLPAQQDDVYRKIATALGVYAKARRWDDVADAANILEEIEQRHIGNSGSRKVHQVVYEPPDPWRKLSEAVFDTGDEKFVEGDTIVRASDIEKLKYADMSPLEDLLGEEAIEALQSDDAVAVFKSLPTPTKRAVMHFVEQTVKKIGDGAVLNRMLVSNGVISEDVAAEDDDTDDDDAEE